ncbi:helix-turn-helix domain-containing protein [Streptomyces sp. H27-D2]|uniref:helix-turn-helix domain-containing protein n=1 Tax=Streptomyces sp. H27-D2 TaxID=3046304 RepID=UPI002DC00099|nr:helix-turn-helix transcriptional regulator [Streptomyces sp. H27-D2]MEC4020647.1 helix-turn-helix transcriptional regulator [Streptomyces sp. H27-D2]
MSSTYGDWFKAQREAAGLTQQKLAEAAIMTRSHIAHIETGRRTPSKEDARRLDRALNTGDVLSSFLPGDDRTVAEHFETARQLEQQATMIREYAQTFVPGILQTERYAHEVLSSAFPQPTPSERDKNVVTRLERAKILNDSQNPVVWALLDEAVLRRPVGGPEVMAEQIAHLIKLMENGRIRVHVLPYTLGVHNLMGAMLTLMWFEDQPPAAYSEGTATGKLFDSPSLVEVLQSRYDLALSDALPLKESLAFLRATVKEYQHHD